MEFSRQGYWSGLLFPSPRAGIKPVSFALAGKFFFFPHSELLYGSFYSFFSIQVTLQTLPLRFEDCEVITQTNKNIWEADC